jgi:putative MFS transporter
MGALLLGGILWGTLGDKRGRLSVLFGSIILYSLANIANGFVQTFSQYAIARFVAGIGLAGELGAGITLVSESLDKEARGYGTTIVASVGILGAVVGALVAKLTFWRTSYFIGGGLGFALLLLRVGVLESGMFERVKQEASVARGSFLRLFSTRERARKYVSVILVGVPIWYSVAILVTFSPEMGKAMHMKPVPDAAMARSSAAASVPCSCSSSLPRWRWRSISRRGVARSSFSTRRACSWASRRVTGRCS